MNKKLKVTLVLVLILAAVLLLQGAVLHKGYIFNGRNINSRVYIAQPKIDSYSYAYRVANWCDFVAGINNGNSQDSMVMFMNGNFYNVTCHFDNADGYGYYTHIVVSAQPF